MPDEMTIEELRQYEDDGTLPKRYRGKTRLEVIHDMGEHSEGAQTLAANAIRRNKYNAEPTEVDGIRFDSKAEARRYQELKLMELAGEIRDLKCHPQYEFNHNNVKITTYKPDFEYQDTETFRIVVEDVKGGKATKSDGFRIRSNLMRAFYGIEVREIDR